MCGSGAVVCSLSLLIRWAQRARCQAETPLIVLFRFLRPALFVNVLDWLNAMRATRMEVISLETAVVSNELNWIAPCVSRRGENHDEPEILPSSTPPNLSHEC